MAKKQFSKNVKFTGLSIKKTARLGFSVMRDNIEWEDADSIFAGSRCSAKIEMKCDPEQTTMLIDGKDVTTIDPIEMVVDIKGFISTREKFTAGLSINLAEVDIEKLAKFANCEGKLSLKRTGDIPDAVAEEAETLAGDEHEEEGNEPAARSHGRRGR